MLACWDALSGMEGIENVADCLEAMNCLPLLLAGEGFGEVDQLGEVKIKCCRSHE